MSLSSRIAPHLPFLRRYARAISGSQSSGDSYVVALLEALVADISLFPKVSDDKVALYKVFTQLFDKLNLEIPEPEQMYAWERHAAANLRAITPDARQAFLLVTIEDFNTEQAAEILGVDANAFSKLIEKASKEISEQVHTDIMIIEDEPMIAMDLEHMVTSLGHNVVGTARTHKEAVEMYNAKNPKMVLADIQLADGSSGVEAVNEILSMAPIPVIFITAFPERLLTGERPEPAFLVTKPFNPDMVKALISQALFFDQDARLAA